MNKLRLVLAAQLLGFLAWGGYLLSSRDADSPEFYLLTEPVDPRDLISGTYVALNYEISRPEAGGCSDRREYGQFFVKLEHKGRTVDIAGGPVPVYEAVDCARRPGGGTNWAAATLQYSGRGDALDYGIEKFFLNENDPRKDAKSGEVVAKVKIGHGRKLVLLDLVRKL